MGVREHKAAAPARVTCAVLTVSDSRTTESDVSGAMIRSRLETSGHSVSVHHVVPDDRERVASSLRILCDDGTVDAVIVTGGTGLAPRDVTYEAVSSMFSRTIDGFGELFRMLSYRDVGPAAMLSRATSGLIGTTVVFVLPGSPAACELALDKLVLPELGHVVGIANPRKWEP